VDRNREAGGDYVDACLSSTQALKECMEAHPDYYSPLLDDAAEAQAEAAAGGPPAKAEPAEKEAAAQTAGETAAAARPQ